MSSSIPSWQILTKHAQPFRGATDLAFCLKVPLDSLLVWASSGGSGETAWMCRLAWTFASRIGNKYQIRLTRSICCGYSLEWHSNFNEYPPSQHGDSTEHPQHTFLWRTEEKYPLTIIKHSPYLFLCACIPTNLTSSWYPAVFSEWLSNQNLLTCQ